MFRRNFHIQVIPVPCNNCTEGKGGSGGGNWCNLKLLSKITGGKKKSPNWQASEYIYWGGSISKQTLGPENLSMCSSPNMRQELGQGGYGEWGPPARGGLGTHRAWAVWKWPVCTSLAVRRKTSSTHCDTLIMISQSWYPPSSWYPSLDTLILIPPLMQGHERCCLQAGACVRCCPWWIWGLMTKRTPKSLRVCMGIVFFRQDFCSWPRQGTLSSLFIPA